MIEICWKTWSHQAMINMSNLFTWLLKECTKWSYILAEETEEGKTNFINLRGYVVTRSPTVEEKGGLSALLFCEGYSQRMIVKILNSPFAKIKFPNCFEINIIPDEPDVEEYTHPERQFERQKRAFEPYVGERDEEVEMKVKDEDTGVMKKVTLKVPN